MEKIKNITIKDWAEDDRPREKMLKKGSSALSNAELLAILICTGTKTDSALDLAKLLLLKSSNNLDEISRLSPIELSKRVKGIGRAKAVSISAAIELGKRMRFSEPIEQRRYNCGEDVAQEFIARLSNLRHEEFWIVLLNNANNEIARYKISSGGITSTIVDSRIILKYAIENLATNLVLIHNHPSGNLNPSRDDLNLTRNIIDCCKPFKISVLDHIIIGNKKYLSFSDEGLLI
jgi:DNA repair protein RadC